MRRMRVWLAVAAVVYLLGGTAWALSVPMYSFHESPVPGLLGESTLRLERGMTLRQQIALPQPTPGETELRLWVKTFPSQDPFLTVRGEAQGRVIGQVDLPIPVVDDRFHKLQLPWWSLPRRARSVTLIVEGHGVVLLATAVDRVPGGDLVVNGTPHPPSDLAIQVVSRQRGIEPYFPLSKVIDGRPGILGSPRWILILGVVYGFVILSLIIGGPRLVRLVGQR